MFIPHCNDVRSPISNIDTVVCIDKSKSRTITRSVMMSELDCIGIPRGSWTKSWLIDEESYMSRRGRFIKGNNSKYLPDVFRLRTRRTMTNMSILHIFKKKIEQKLMLINLSFHSSRLKKIKVSLRINDEDKEKIVGNLRALNANKISNVIVNV